MPTQIKVRVSAVNHITVPSKTGAELHFVELTGFCAETNKGYKKRFFAVNQDGSAKPEAEIADTLVQNDWVCLTLDDTAYKNVQTIQKIAPPAGMPTSQPAQQPVTNSTPPLTAPPSAKKSARTADVLIRDSALNLALQYLSIRGIKEDTDNVASVIDVASRFATYMSGISNNPAPAAPRNTVVSAEDGERMLQQEREAAQQANEEIPF